MVFEISTSIRFWEICHIFVYWHTQQHYHKLIAEKKKHEAIPPPPPPRKVPLEMGGGSAESDHTSLPAPRQFAQIFLLDLTYEFQIFIWILMFYAHPPKQNVLVEMFVPNWH